MYLLDKLSFAALSDYPNVDMLRVKDLNHFATECVIPRRPKRCLATLPEDKECSNTELKKSSKFVNRKRKIRRQFLKLPALPEYDEC